MLYLERRVIYSSPGFAGWLAALYSSPSCAATHSTNQEEETQHFSVHHTVNVLQDQHLLEASDLLWRCCAAAYVCVMDQHLSSAIDLLSVYKPSAQESHKERHQSWFPTQDSSGPVCPQRKMAVMSGWTLKEAEHFLMDTTFLVRRGCLCQPGYRNMAPFVLLARFGFGLGWFGFTHVALCVLCIHLNNRNKGCDPRSG